MHNSLSDDLEQIMEQGGLLWPSLQGARFFVTGGTGFIGCWLLETLAWLDNRLDLGLNIVVLTRNPGAFAARAPHLAAHPAIVLHQGDIRSFVFPEGEFSFVVHGATDASAKLNAENPLCMFDTIVDGTRRALEFAVRSAGAKFLFLSSGAVYGEQSPHVLQRLETDQSGPDCTSAQSAYAEGKRTAELQCALYAAQHGVQAKIARCFAFVGPYLPLDTHFAIGNFIRDATAGREIVVNGDGTPYRSYLYASDLAVWLLTILLRGQVMRPYNVGSNQAISIAELAALVNRVLSGKGVRIMQQSKPGALPKRYVPSVTRAATELGLNQTVSLEQAITKTASNYPAHWRSLRGLGGSAVVFQALSEGGSPTSGT